MDGNEKFRRPEMAEVALHAAKSGLPENEAQKFWLFYQSKGWKVGKSPMKNWHCAMAGWKIRWEEKRLSDPLRPTSSETFVRNQELQRVLEKMKAIKHSYSEHQEWTDPDIARFRELKARKLELMKLLGLQA
jgi:hypothetical protein